MTAIAAILSLAATLSVQAPVEKRLAVVPDGVRITEFQVGADGVPAYLASQRGKQWVVVGDQKHPEYEKIQGLSVSADGKSVTYLAQSGKWRAVVGGQPQEEYDNIRDLTLSPDGRKVAYHAQRGSRWRAVIGGEEGDSHEFTGNLLFSPDGSTVAYQVTNARRSCVVVGRDEGKEYDQVHWSTLRFNADGKGVTYAATNGSSVFIVTGTQEGPKQQAWRDSIPALSPDGKTLATIVPVEMTKGNRRWGGSCVVVGTKKGPAFEQIDKHSLAFTADGSDVFYRANSMIEFQPNHFRPGESFWVLGGKRLEGGPPPAAEKESTFLGVADGRPVVVVGNKKIPATGPVRRIVVSPDGKSVAFTEGQEGSMRVVAGSRISDVYEQVSAPVFSADGKKVGFGALVRNELWWKVIEVD